MNKVKVVLWGREFDIAVSYSCYPGEEITQIQKDALTEFCVKENPADSMLNELKQYVIKTADGKLEGTNIENIFKYVIPKSLYIPRSPKKMVAVICNYKFDMENGIAVVFENEKLKQIGTQDIIL